MKRYTKTHLERIIYAQLTNLDAVHDLLKLLREQNALIEKVNAKLKFELEEKKLKVYEKVRRKKSS